MASSGEFWQRLMGEDIDVTSTSFHWRLADFFSSYRYWALLVAALVVAVGHQALVVMLPAALHTSGLSVTSIGAYYTSQQFGWISGAFVAFMVAPRCGRLALMVPVAICALIAAAGLWAPDLLASPGYLVVFGLANGTVQTVFSFAAAIYLASGRPDKRDFAPALVVITATAIPAMIVSATFNVTTLPDTILRVVYWIAFGSLICALLILLPCKQLAFDDAPRARHRPLVPRRRSPLVVGSATLIPAIAVGIGMMLIASRWLTSRYGLFSGGHSARMEVWALFGVVAAAVLCVVAYIGRWFYRIHGELAGVSASQRLLTPRAAAWVSLFAPLGVPVLLMTLGDLLNERHREQHPGRVISMGWFGLCCFLLPPLAMAWVQHAANKSYAGLNHSDR